MFELVRKIIAEETGLREDEITLKSNLVEDFGLESMDIYNLVDALYDAGIEIEAGIVFETVEDIVNAAEES